MTGGKAAALLARAVGVVIGTVFMACLILPLTAHQASACDVGIGYPPSFHPKSLDLSKHNLGFGTPCSTGNSLTGVAIVAVLALGALAAAGTVAFRRGEATATSPSAAGTPDEALTNYLHAAGMASPAPPAADHGHADGEANTIRLACRATLIARIPG